MEDSSFPTIVPTWALFYCKARDTYCFYTATQVTEFTHAGLKELVTGINSVYKDSLRIKKDDGECPFPFCPDRRPECSARLSDDDSAKAVEFVEKLLGK